VVQREDRYCRVEGVLVERQRLGAGDDRRRQVGWALARIPAEGSTAST
jgi:hypothetical protein